MVYEKFTQFTGAQSLVLRKKHLVGVTQYGEVFFYTTYIYPFMKTGAISGLQLIFPCAMLSMM